MAKRTALLCLVANLGLLLGAATTRAQSGIPNVANGKVEEHGVTLNLSASVSEIANKDAGPFWIGYSVDEVAGQGAVCCQNYHDSDGDGGCGTCRLENEHSGVNVSGKQQGTIELEGGQKLVVLLRAADRKVMRVRIVSAGCTLDAGGSRLIWLTGVKPEESVALLSTYVKTADFRGEDDGPSDQALAAIALHADPAADRALDRFVAPNQPFELRKRTVFWLGEARGAAGLATLQRLAKTESNEEVRSQVTFALSVSKEPKAIDEMVRMAHEDQSSHVRGQALFWLAQKAGKKASSTITGAIDNDPDTEVKKKAVFALSQMPKDEGVPKLIEVAQTNHNPEVRKQAMFWLGQSNDPRALAFFEKLLTQ